MPGATSVIYSLHSEYREEGKKKKKKRMERASSRFPLFSFLASDLRCWTLWGVQKWESCSFPVITQYKVSPSTQRVTHTPRQTCKHGVYLRASCLREQMRAHVKKHLDAINPFSGAESERERDQCLFSYWLTSFSTTSSEPSRYLFTGEAQRMIYDSFFSGLKTKTIKC